MSMADRDSATMRVIEELKRIYKTKLMPLETLYKFEWFYQPLMTDAEFDSKPQVLLIGQYSVGKTSVGLLPMRLRPRAGEIFACDPMSIHANMCVALHVCCSTICVDLIDTCNYPVYPIFARKRLSWAANWPRAHHRQICSCNGRP
jgi:hypothetical protein